MSLYRRGGWRRRWRRQYAEREHLLREIGPVFCVEWARQFQDIPVEITCAVEPRSIDALPCLEVWVRAWALGPAQPSADGRTVTRRIHRVEWRRVEHAPELSIDFASFQAERDRWGWDRHLKGNDLELIPAADRARWGFAELIEFPVHYEWAPT